MGNTGLIFMYWILLVHWFTDHYAWHLTTLHNQQVAHRLWMFFTVSLLGSINNLSSHLDLFAVRCKIVTDTEHFQQKSMSLSQFKRSCWLSILRMHCQILPLILILSSILAITANDVSLQFPVVSEPFPTRLTLEVIHIGVEGKMFL